MDFAPLFFALELVVRNIIVPMAVYSTHVCVFVSSIHCLISMKRMKYNMKMKIQIKIKN